MKASLDLLVSVGEALELKLHELFRVHEEDPRDQAVDRLLRMASRLSLDEIELVMDVGQAVVGHTRRAATR